MRIRLAKKSDAENISKLRGKIIERVFSKDYSKKVIGLLLEKHCAKKIEGQIGEGRVFCLFDGEKLIGTIYLIGNKIGGLYLKRGYMGRGLGRKLLKYVERFAKKRGIKKLFLYSSLNAEGFYLKHGYKLVRDEIGFEEVGGIRVPVMEKRL